MIIFHAEILTREVDVGILSLVSFVKNDRKPNFLIRYFIYVVIYFPNGRNLLVSDEEYQKDFRWTSDT